jgi:hypothetical protein
MTKPDHCILQAPLFSSLGEVTFRRAESDGTPVMTVPLGAKLAALPLRAVQREFQIPDDSDDGRMLALIAESLDFVGALRLGDPLPAEVLTGDASWELEPRYLKVSLGKLRMQLLAWFDPQAAAQQAQDAVGLERMESDPVMRAQVQRAFEQAAAALNLPGPEQAVATLGRIAQEMAYIEALREELLLPVCSMHSRLGTLRPGQQIGADRKVSLDRVRRLSAMAVEKILARFTDVDSQTAELSTGLRNAASQCVFIRSNRDWLYRSKRAWDPILRQWAAASPELDNALWLLVGRTYQFLAPRFMPVQEWPSALGSQQPRGPKKQERAMTW